MSFFPMSDDELAELDVEMLRCASLITLPAPTIDFMETHNPLFPKLVLVPFLTAKRWKELSRQLQNPHRLHRI
jgi:hypothetical protein